VDNGLPVQAGRSGVSYALRRYSLSGETDRLSGANTGALLPGGQSPVCPGRDR